MKTILIIDQCGQDALKYLVLSGDQSKYKDVYINTMPPEGKDVEEWNDLTGELWGVVGNADGSDFREDLLLDFPVAEVEPDTLVISCGFVP